MLRGRLLWASSSRYHSNVWLCTHGYFCKQHSNCDRFVLTRTCVHIMCQCMHMCGGRSISSANEDLCFLLSCRAASQDKADVVADIAQSLVRIQEADVVVQLGNALVVSGHIPEATQLASTLNWWPCCSSAKHICSTCVY